MSARTTLPGANQQSSSPSTQVDEDDGYDQLFSSKSEIRGPIGRLDPTPSRTRPGQSVMRPAARKPISSSTMPRALLSSQTYKAHNNQKKKTKQHATLIEKPQTSSRKLKTPSPSQIRSATVLVRDHDAAVLSSGDEFPEPTVSAILKKSAFNPQNKDCNKISSTRNAAQSSRPTDVSTKVARRRSSLKPIFSQGDAIEIESSDEEVKITTRTRPPPTKRDHKQLSKTKTSPSDFGVISLSDDSDPQPSRLTGSSTKTSSSTQKRHIGPSTPLRKPALHTSVFNDHSSHKTLNDTSRDVYRNTKAAPSRSPAISRISQSGLTLVSRRRESVNDSVSLGIGKRKRVDDSYRDNLTAPQRIQKRFRDELAMSCDSSAPEPLFLPSPPLAPVRQSAESFPAFTLDQLHTPTAVAVTPARGSTARLGDDSPVNDSRSQIPRIDFTKYKPDLTPHKKAVSGNAAGEAKVKDRRTAVGKGPPEASGSPSTVSVCETQKADKHYPTPPTSEPLDTTAPVSRTSLASSESQTQSVPERYNIHPLVFPSMTTEIFRRIRRLKESNLSFTSGSLSLHKSVSPDHEEPHRNLAPGEDLAGFMAENPDTIAHGPSSAREQVGVMQDLKASANDAVKEVENSGSGNNVSDWSGNVGDGWGDRGGGWDNVGDCWDDRGDFWDDDLDSMVLLYPD
ncbi:hypothetical protein D9758_003757 [Tetrapyrgos nigripes]|uniref:Uncharacterized protein n=1 Tax=Tetrapyrgos nigripes TaxID=182062 RepID=A0A8H5GMC4_9AGAR|nr:hypothetical protein D9758_003757 [Tetrapyrgos nigripes]